MEEKKEKKQVSLVVVIILGIVVAFAVGYACKMIKNNKAKEEQKVEEKEIKKEEDENKENLKLGTLEENSSLDNLKIDNVNYSVSVEIIKNTDEYSKVKYIVNDTPTVVEDDSNFYDAEIYNIDGYLVILQAYYHDYTNIYMFNKDGKLIDTTTFLEETEKINNIKKPLENKKFYSQYGYSGYTDYNPFRSYIYYSSGVGLESSKIITNMSDYCDKDFDTYGIIFELHCNENGFYTDIVSEKCEFNDLEEVDEVIPIYFCDSNKNDIYSKLVNYWNNSYLAFTSNIEEYKKNSVIKNEPSIDCNRAIKYNEYTDHEISDLCSNKENCIVIPEDDGLSNVIVYDGTNVYEIIENGVDEYSDELNTYYATQTLFELTDLCKTCNGYTLNPKQRLGTKERWNSFVVDVEYSDGNKETFDIDLINKKLNNRK